MNVYTAKAIIGTVGALVVLGATIATKEEACLWGLLLVLMMMAIID